MKQCLLGTRLPQIEALDIQYFSQEGINVELSFYQLSSELVDHFQKTVICVDQLQLISELQEYLSSESLQFDRSLIAKITNFLMLTFI